MNTKEVLKRMHHQEIYIPTGKALMKEQRKHQDILYTFNQTKPSELKKRKRLLKKMFREIGDHCYIEGRINANWGGKNVHFGNNIYVNFNLTLVDDTDIFVGDHVMIAPNVTISTAAHPIHPALGKERFNIIYPYI